MIISYCASSVLLVGWNYDQQLLYQPGRMSNIKVFRPKYHIHARKNQYWNLSRLSISCIFED